MIRRTWVFTVLIVTALLGLGVTPGVATAHGDEGEMTVITAEQTGPRMVRLLVGILYTNDEDLAVDAKVTVAGTGPEDATLPATIALDLEEGAKYGGTIEVPADGSWTFTITSTDPAASASASVEVVAEPVATTDAPSTTAPSPDTTAPSQPQPEATSADSDAESGNGPLLVILGGIGIVLAVGAALFVRSSRAKRTTDA